MTYLMFLVIFCGLFYENINLAKATLKASDPECECSYLWNALAKGYNSFQNYPMYDSSVRSYVSTPPAKINLTPQFILTPIQYPNYPLKIIELKDNILNYLAEQDYDFSTILEPILRYSPHSTDLDIMVSALTRIRDLIPEDCDRRRDFNLLLIYLLETKYTIIHGANQSDHGTLDTNALETIFRQPIMPLNYQQFPIRTYLEDSHLVSSGSNTYYHVQVAVSPIIQLLEQILAKMDDLKRSDTHTGNSQVLHDAPLPVNPLNSYLESNFNSRIIATNVYSLQIVLNPIVQLLEHILAKMDDFKRASRSTHQFVQADVPVLIPAPTPDFHIVPTPEIVIQTTTQEPEPLTTVPTTTPAPPKYQYLIEKLPVPKNDAERVHYETISAFLSRQDLESLIGGSININSYKNEHDLLKAIFARSVTLKLSKIELAAVKFYLEYEVALAKLSLFTRKEILKQFDLSGIILDTLNLEQFTDSQREAFDKFFQFILNVKGDEMSHFETWIEAKTKGEFMKLLFDFFLSSTFVPEEIKFSIKLIIPCIKMTDEGAEPV